MKKGDIIGITYGFEKEVSLVAEVTTIAPNGVVFFWVWNGASEGRIHPNGLVEAYDGQWLVTKVNGCNICFTGKVPVARSYDYNSAIEYMNAHLKRNAIERWWLQATERATTHIQRFKAACSAFVKVWRGEKLVPIDDTIPF